MILTEWQRYILNYYPKTIEAYCIKFRVFVIKLKIRTFG